MTTTPPKDWPPRNDYERDEAESRRQLKSAKWIAEQYKKRQKEEKPK
jgi:hypothetical protein